MIIPTGFAQVNFFFSGNAVLRGAQVVIGVENINDVSALSLAAGAGAAWESEILPLQDESILLEKVKAKLGPNATGPEASQVSGQQGGGTSGGLPPNVSLLVVKHTSLGGRKGKGHMNIPAMPEDDTLGGGFVDPAKIGAWQDAVDAFLLSLATQDIPMVILHSDATTPTPVSDLSVQSLLATQKRRLRRAGGHS